jgi:hypothetical protein
MAMAAEDRSRQRSDAGRRRKTEEIESLPEKP